MLCFLKENRTRKQITQADLATAMGYKYPDPIGKFEKGVCPSLYNALRISYFLGVPIEKIWRLEKFEYGHKKPLPDKLDELATRIYEEMLKEYPYLEGEDREEAKFDRYSNNMEEIETRVTRKDYISLTKSKRIK